MEPTYMSQLTGESQSDFSLFIYLASSFDDRAIKTETKREERGQPGTLSRLYLFIFYISPSPSSHYP